MYNIILCLNVVSVAIGWKVMIICIETDPACYTFFYSMLNFARKREGEEDRG